jgi:hypothetical protein
MGKTTERDKKTIEEENKRAPEINPEKSGIRTGNPQLDPDAARKPGHYPGRKEEKPHAPEVDPEHE